MEERQFLGHITDHVAEGRDVGVGKGLLADEDLTLLRLVKADQQVDQGGLASPRRPLQHGDPAGRNGERDIGQDGLVSVVEVHMRKGEIFPRRRRQCAGADLPLRLSFADHFLGADVGSLDLGGVLHLLQELRNVGNDLQEEDADDNQLLNGNANTHDRKPC